MNRPTYTPGRYLTMHGRRWIVIGMLDRFTTIVERDDGVRRELSNEHIRIALQETERMR